ncbi:MAG: DMT family transporter [Candidatus Aminicenantales bacterium]
MHEKHRSLFEIHAAVALFGTAGLFGKWLLLSPFIIVLGRVFFASCALGLFFLFSAQALRVKSRKTFGLLGLLGFLLAVHWVAFFHSIQVSTVAVGLLSYSSFPVFTAFLEPVMFREKLEASFLGFAFLCVLGVFLIIPRFDMTDTTTLGVLWGLLAGLTFAVLTIINRRLSQVHSSWLIAFYQDFWATVFLLPFAFVLRPSLTSRDVALLVVLGVFCTAGSHSLFIKGMRHIRARAASVISSLEPVYGILFALVLLGEVPSLRTVMGGALILAAAFAVTLRGSRPATS